MLDVCIPFGFVPRPFETTPLSLRSMFQLSVAPSLFFSVKANTAFPCLIAALRSASDDERAALMTSKASEAGKASIRQFSKMVLKWKVRNSYRS